MTATLTAPAPPSPAEPLPRGGARRRVLALAGAEIRLLLRNRTAVVNSLLMPLLPVAGIAVITRANGGELDGARIVTSAIGVTLVFLTYANLVTTFVARREDLVLQRMRTGELTEAEVLLGTAVPTLLVTAVQIVLVGAGVAVLGRWSAPVDVVLPLLAVVGGGALMVALAAASTSIARTVESAQLSTLPLVLATTTLSGLMIPLTGFPEQLAQAARFLPLNPVIELAQLGLVGESWDGRAVDTAGAWAAAPLPLAVLAGWLVGGALLARLVFRWAPRR